LSTTDTKTANIDTTQLQLWAQSALSWFTHIQIPTMTNGSVSSGCVKQRGAKGNYMKRVIMKDDAPAALTAAQEAQLTALQGRSPNTADLPEASEENWRHARQFYKPRKEPISIRVDADILDWLRRKSDRYQTEINRILRKEMDAEIPS